MTEATSGLLERMERVADDYDNDAIPWVPKWRLAVDIRSLIAELKATRTALAAKERDLESANAFSDTLAEELAAKEQRIEKACSLLETASFELNGSVAVWVSHVRAALEDQP